MAAYLISDVDVTKPEQYAEYRKLSTLAIAAHGAEICIRGGAVTPLEGGWEPSRIVMLKFPSIEKARAFYDSAEYRRAREAREGAATMRMIVVEGTE